VLGMAGISVILAQLLVYPQLSKLGATRRAARFAARPHAPPRTQLTVLVVRGLQGYGGRRC
jgi:hypothetical protein